MAQTYFVECYWPGVDAAQLEVTASRLARSETALWVESTLVAADEIVLSVFEADSPEAVRSSAARAGLAAERIVECVRLLNDRKGGGNA
jgi:hypothetical protein